MDTPQLLTILNECAQTFVVEKRFLAELETLDASDTLPKLVARQHLVVDEMSALLALYGSLLRPK
jgi:hypothetical protein